MKIITTYTCPDLDGVACIIAYNSLLTQLGIQSKGTYDGDIGLETEFVKNKTGYFPLQKIESYDNQTDIVLVDVSDTNDLHKTLNPNNVTEIIDHRKIHFAHKFPNAKVDIQMVGSCATLIYERFIQNKFVPNLQEATYLYSAIISNTINLKNKLTTNRDILAAESLLKISAVESDYVQKMFLYKSNVNASNLRDVLIQDVAIKDYKDKKISILQLEVVDVHSVINDNLDIIYEIFNRLKEEYKLDYIMLNGIDILNGYNVIMVNDKESSDLFSKAFGIDLPLKIPAKIPEIIMRKEIWSRLESL